jgi:hypothetical protein
MPCVPAVRARTALTIFRKLRGCKTGTQAQLGNFLVRAVSHCHSWGYLGLKEGAHLPRVGGGGYGGCMGGAPTTVYACASSISMTSRVWAPQRRVWWRGARAVAP